MGVITSAACRPRDGDGELSYEEFKWWWENDMSYASIQEKNLAVSMSGVAPVQGG